MPRTLEAIDEALICLEKMFAQRFEDGLTAIQIAREGMEQRLEGMNEFRDQLNRQAATFIGRAELEDKVKVMETNFKSLEKRVQGVELLKADITGRIWTLGIVMTILVIFLEFAVHYVLVKH